MIILIYTDGKEGAYECRIETAARMLGVAYVTYTESYLRRWQMTEPFRTRRRYLLNSTR